MGSSCGRIKGVNPAYTGDIMDGIVGKSKKKNKGF